jgi:hypothetical protein
MRYFLHTEDLSSHPLPRRLEKTLCISISSWANIFKRMGNLTMLKDSSLRVDQKPFALNLSKIFLNSVWRPLFSSRRKKKAPF